MIRVQRTTAPQTGEVSSEVMRPRVRNSQFASSSFQLRLQGRQLSYGFLAWLWLAPGQARPPGHCKPASMARLGLA